jgi:hypothetical protein
MQTWLSMLCDPWSCSSFWVCKLLSLKTYGSPNFCYLEIVVCILGVHNHALASRHWLVTGSYAGSPNFCYVEIVLCILGVRNHASVSQHWLMTGSYAMASRPRPAPWTRPRSTPRLHPCTATASLRSRTTRHHRCALPHR